MLNAIVLLLFALTLMIVSPLLVIWALNTLFGCGIIITFWTWCAALILLGAIKGTVTVKKDK